MKRRTLLKYTSLATGAAVGAPLMGILLSGCQPEVVDNYVPTFFTPEEYGQVKALLDLILPKTDSPSATEVGVQQIMDKMLAEVYTAEEQTEFREGYLALSTHLAEAGFFKMKKEKQLAFLKILGQSEDELLEKAKAAFVDLKQQAIAYYLSTKEVATQFLNYLPVPGKYEPCISVAEVGGKAWAI